MADLLGSIFGGGQKTDQTMKPDRIQQQMNQERLNQVQQLFGRTGLSEFAGPGGDAYTPSQDVLDLQNTLRSSMRSSDPRNDFNLQDYQRQGEQRLSEGLQTAQRTVRDTYGTAQGANRRARDLAAQTQDQALGRGRALAAESFETGRRVNRAGLDVGREGNRAALETSRGINRASLDTARGGVNEAYGRGRQDVRGTYDAGRGTVRAARDEGLAQAAQSGQTALGVSERAFERGRREALDQTSGYIAQVADPQIKQAAALQGLEGGGMVPASIARATAEYGGNILGPLLQQYMSGQTGIANTQQQQEGALSQQFAGSEASLLQQLMGGEQGLASQLLGAESALGSQYMGAESAAGNQYMTGEQALSNQYLGGEQALSNQLLSGDQAMLNNFMQALAGIDQSAMGAESALGQGLLQSEAGIANNYANNLMNFNQTMPSAAETFGLMPGRINAMNAQAAGYAMPLFDYQRSLKEQDLMRRQGLAQTAFTGIPFQAGSSTNQRQSQQPLFNFFGQG